jgi:hypothetical protein
MVRASVMNDRRLGIFGLFLLTPSTAFASGDYVLTALLIDFVLFLFISIMIFALKIRWTGKLILFLAYIISLYFLFHIIDQVNYLENLAMINIGSALLPPTIVYLTYKAIENPFQKNNC